MTSECLKKEIAPNLLLIDSIIYLYFLKHRVSLLAVELFSVSKNLKL